MFSLCVAEDGKHVSPPGRINTGSKGVLLALSGLLI